MEIENLKVLITGSDVTAYQKALALTEFKNMIERLEVLEKIIKVKVLTDDSGHWYIVQNDLADRFLRDLRNEAMIESGEFDEKYGRYRVGVNINFKQLYAVLE